MIYKSGRYYMAKFRWKGQLIRKSTRATDAKTARSIEGKMRVELARGNWGLLEKKPVPTLGEFLKREFLPFVETKCADKENTLAYYRAGAARLQASDLAGLSLDEITDQHAGEFAKRWECFKPTTVNCGLRTLRRALSLAYEWGKLDRKPKITLAKGERQRDRVVTDDEATRYLAACPQPWKDVATVMLGSGACPGELYVLRWENVLLNGQSGLLHIVKGKTKARRRLLPMVSAVFQALKSRWEAQGCPSEGWVFPTGSVSGHMEESSAKQWHAKAFTTLEKARKENPDLPEIKPFEPYCLRHTALTNLSKAGVDAFTLMRIAGHSRISTTERYIHPQAEAIEQAFARLAGSQKVVTDGGHSEMVPTTR
jgi:integrase